MSRVYMSRIVYWKHVYPCYCQKPTSLHVPLRARRESARTVKVGAELSGVIKKVDVNVT